MSPRTFFRYFASKEDVLFAESDAQRARFFDVLAAQPRENSPLQALQVAVLTVAADYEDRRDTILLRHRIVTSTPSLRSHKAERHHGWEAR